MSELLSGKVAVVTGAAAPTGIGAATAELFASHGAAVVIADVDRDQGEATAQRIRGAGGACEFVAADVTREADVAAVVDRAVVRFGGLDVAVNNAAIVPDDRPVAELDVDRWNRVLAVNLTGVAICLKYELRSMVARGVPGSIVNVSSIRGFRPSARRPAYVASKHGIVGLTKNAAVENGEFGIRVNTLAPGAVDTPMYRESLERFNVSHEDYVPQVSLLGRIGRADEIAQGALWLCSDLSSYVTASTLHVDGGFVHR